MHKIGNSIDIHPLVKGAPLMIGGVKIDSEFGSVSNSDGDALIHSVTEALFGALGKGDLGDHYPTTKSYKNTPSSEFLKDAVNSVKEEGFNISNIDIMIVLEKPKIGSYKTKVIDNLSKLLEIDSSKINLKAGTNEKIGSIGNSESYLVWTSLILEK